MIYCSLNSFYIPQNYSYHVLQLHVSAFVALYLVFIENLQNLFNCQQKHLIDTSVLMHIYTFFKLTIQLTS